MKSSLRTMWRLGIRIGLLGLSGAGVTLAVSAQEGPPKCSGTSVTRRDGFELFRETIDRLQQTPDSILYSLCQDGKPKWEKRKPYLLDAAMVSQTGYIAAYGYVTIPESEPIDKERFLSTMLCMVILDPEGNELYDERVRSRLPTYPHGRASPFVNGILLDDIHHRVIFRLNGNKTWVERSLKDGLETDRFDPANLCPGDGDTKYVTLDAHVFPETGFVLIHWESRGRDRGENVYGSRFSLVDQKWKRVWNLEKPTDYTIRDDSETQTRLLSTVRAGGCLVVFPEGRQLEVVSVQDKKKLRFELRMIDGAAKVHKIDETPYDFISERSIKLSTSRPVQHQIPATKSGGNP